MEVAEHIDAIDREAKLFAETATEGGLDISIGACPGWTMRDLVRHLAEIHLWAAAHVSLRATKMWVDDLEDLSGYWPDLAVFWPDDDDLVDYYLRTNANLVAELASASSDLAAMTFLPAPSPLAMWARRQAHETAVHRADTELAIGREPSFDPAFAADGIDELLMAFAPRGETFPVDRPVSLAVHASDVGNRWHITMTPDGIKSVRSGVSADVSITGPASMLYLALWNRGDHPSMDVQGDVSVLESWHAGHRIRWT